MPVSIPLGVATAVVTVVAGGLASPIPPGVGPQNAADSDRGAGLQRYVELVRLQDSPKIAAFLDSFAAYRLHSHDMTVTRVVVDPPAVTR